MEQAQQTVQQHAPTSPLASRSRTGLGSWSGLALGLLTVALAGCGSQISTQAPAAPHEYSLTVQVTPDDSLNAIASQYSADVVAWHPEAGFAVLALDAPPAQSGVRALGLGLQRSRGAYSIAGTSAWAGGTSAWAGGTSAWAGGTSAWAGGTSAWAGGTSAWAGGTSAWAGGWGTAPEDTGFNVVATNNAPIYNQVHLAAGQALAPKLGADTTVAVIDTGVDLKHIVFANRLTPSNTWKDFVDGDAEPQDAPGGSNAGYGHGTAVAGAVLQVAPNAKIMPIRVLDSQGIGDSTNLVAAIDWAVQNGAKVINLSLGSENETSDVSSEIAWATAQGVYFVASAGNGGRDAVFFPAALGASNDRVIGVGSVSTSLPDVKSLFSNYGAALDMVGPGEHLWGPAPEASITWWSGTSFAAPQAAGTLALALAEGAGQGLKAALVTGDDVSAVNPAYAGLLGDGRLNVEKFLSATLN